MTLRSGRKGRVRRSITGSAVAAAAMAALTASQAPELVAGEAGAAPERDGSAAEDQEPEASGARDEGEGLPYHTELPPLDTAEGDTAGGDGQDAEVSGESGIPATVLDAYQRAERVLADTDPACHLDWEVLAAIGKVESGHARGGAVDADGTTTEPILGPVLNGDGYAQILDTDDGAWDGDSEYDRAVGPMQFIPSTWAVWGADGNNDGREDPNNVYDAALAAGDYLCSGDRDLSTDDGLERALLSYNNSSDYVSTVLAWLDYYRRGVHEVPDGQGTVPTSPGAGNAGSGDGDRDGRATGGGRDGSDTGSGQEEKPGGDGSSSAPPPTSGTGRITQPGDSEDAGDSGNSGNAGNAGDEDEQEGTSPSPSPEESEDTAEPSEPEETEPEETEPDETEPDETEPEETEPEEEDSTGPACPTDPESGDGTGDTADAGSADDAEDTEDATDAQESGSTGDAQDTGDGQTGETGETGETGSGSEDTGTDGCDDGAGTDEPDSSDSSAESDESAGQGGDVAGTATTATGTGAVTRDSA